MLAAGMKGIEEGYELPREAEDDVWSLTERERTALGIEPLPKNLHDAIDIAERSELLAETLGRARLRLLPAQQARGVGGVPRPGLGLRARPDAPGPVIGPVDAMSEPASASTPEEAPVRGPVERQLNAGLMVVMAVAALIVAYAVLYVVLAWDGDGERTRFASIQVAVVFLLLLGAGRCFVARPTAGRRPGSRSVVHRACFALLAGRACSPAAACRSRRARHVAAPCCSTRGAA